MQRTPPDRSQSSARVSILTRPGGRVQLSSSCSSSSVIWFQSSPVPEDGCNAGISSRDTHGIWVSILTRPGGRVQPVWRHAASTVHAGFNPHPSRRTGATVAKLRKGDAYELFQSSPVPEDGCNSSSVSAARTPVRVSILTRPGGRVQQLYRINDRARRFQSSPVPEDGCNGSPGVPDAIANCFNPHPSRRTGATALRLLRAEQSQVSILTRPGGRVQLHSPQRRCRKSPFQSSPVPEDGCNTCRKAAGSGSIWFQSSPVPEDGCN